MRVATAGDVEAIVEMKRQLIESFAAPDRSRMPAGTSGRLAHCVRWLGRDTLRYAVAEVDGVVS